MHFYWHSVNTQLALCWAPWCYWSAVDCDGRATCNWSGWRRCCLEDCWECCSSLRLARSGVRFSEARWSQRVSWSGWFPLKSSLTSSCCWLNCDLQNVPREHAKCTPGNVRANQSEASCWLTGRSWLRRLLNCLEADPSENTARNSTRIVAIVGYHGNPLYRAVAWIPICISVIWSSKFLTCGRFTREAPTKCLPMQTLLYVSFK
jgi:hypothetical protein